MTTPVPFAPVPEEVSVILADPVVAPAAYVSGPIATELLAARFVPLCEENPLLPTVQFASESCSPLPE